MAFLLSDNSVSIFNSETVKIIDSIPVGIYKLEASRTGLYLEKTEMKLEYGKLYGNTQKIADHICKAFKILDKDKNLGVLLSGGRGLGKTLTTRVVINQLKDKYPIIVISEYYQDVANFLNSISGCVILIDEFEKIMSGEVDSENNSGGQTKQEQLLSVFDGNAGSKGNLFLLTANEVNRLDNNFLSRPGRIRYHYKFISEKADVITDYCNDNLVRKELIPEILEIFKATRYVSMDMIAAIVNELNDFPDISPKDAIEYVNFEQDTAYLIRVFTTVNDKKLVYEHSYRNLNDIDQYETFDINRELSDKISNEDIDEDEVQSYICCQFNLDKFPRIVFGDTILPNDALIPSGRKPPKIGRIQLIDKIAERTV